MPAAIPVVFAAIAFAKGAIAATTFWIIAAMSAANFIMSQVLRPSEQEFDLPNTAASDRGHLINSKGTNESLPLIYGLCRVGLNIVYMEVSNSDNKFLHIIGTIGEGEINGVHQVDGVDQIWLNDKLYNDSLYTGLVNYTVYTGTATQIVDTTLKGYCPDWNDALRNTAYIYIRLEWDRNVFQGLPLITLQVEGLKVYNPATGLTEYSNDPALCAMDYMTRSARRGGIGINISRLDSDTVTSCAAYNTIKGWTIGIPITEQQAVADNLSQILSTYRGGIAYSGGEFKFRYRDLYYESSVEDIDEYDVVSSGNESSLTISQPSIFDTPNAIRLKFLDEEIGYQMNDYVQSEDALVTADGDYREETITIKGINSITNAMKMSYYHLERYRINKMVDFMSRMRLLALEPYDIVTLTHSIPGWTDKYLRVLSTRLTQNGDILLSFIEENPLLYDDVYNISSHNWKDTNYILPTTPPPSVGSASMIEEVYYYRDRSFTRLKVSFSAPSASIYPFWDYAQVWVKIGSGDWKYMTKVENDYQIDPVNEGETYYVKFVSVNIWGVTEDFSSATTISKIVEGKTDVPGDIDSLTAIASGDTIALAATAITDPDIVGYEIRLGTSWESSVFFGLFLSPIVSRSGIKPGTFTFWMAPKGNNGLYATTPRSATVTIFYPSGYVDIATWAWDFSTGTFDNTEADTYGGNPVLKCSHAPELMPNQVDRDFSGACNWVNHDIGGSFDTTGDLSATATAAGQDFQLPIEDAPTIPGNTYRLTLDVANLVGEWKIYDNDGAVDLLMTITADGVAQTHDFVAVGTGGFIFVASDVNSSGDFDNFSLKRISPSALTGTWLSPEYDLGSVMPIRIWGDFLTTVLSGDKWEDITDASTTWSEITTATTKWSELLGITGLAASLNAKIYWGDVSGALTNSADFFQLLSPEFSARYVQVEVTITDATPMSHLYLYTLNMIAAYWS